MNTSWSVARCSRLGNFKPDAERHPFSAGERRKLVSDISQLSQVLRGPRQSAVRAFLRLAFEVPERTRKAGATFALQFNRQHILRANRGFHLVGHGFAYISCRLLTQQNPISERGAE